MEKNTPDVIILGQFLKMCIYFSSFKYILRLQKNGGTRANYAA